MSIAESPAAPIVRKSKVKRMSEMDTRSVPVNPKATIAMPEINEPVERESPIILPEPGLVKDGIDKLAFAEDPVTILIHRSGEKFAPRSTDFIGVNGKGAEMLFKNGWVPIGYLPRGQRITTKRKYIEVMARSKHDHVTTQVLERPGDNPENHVEFSTTSTCSFTVLHDPSPLGTEWLSQLLRQQG